MQGRHQFARGVVGYVPRRGARRMRTAEGVRLWSSWVWVCGFFSLAVGGPARVAVAGDGVSASGVLSTAPDSSLAFLVNVPPEAKHVVPVLRRVVEVTESRRGLERYLKQARAEQDAVKTKVAAVHGELELLAERRRQLSEQLAELERQQQGRIDALRRDLEVKLERELSQTTQVIGQDVQQESDRELHAFEIRLQGVVGTAADQDIELWQRETDQLSREVDTQMQELLDRLARLNANPEVASSLQRATNEALAKRKAELDAHRAQLAAEREALLARRRSEFISQLKQHQAAESQRRLTVKEASLRSAMAELLHKTAQEESGQLVHLRRSLEEITQRHTLLAQEQGTLSARVQAFDQDIASKARRLDTLEQERQVSLTRLEQAFQRSNPGLDPALLAWFGQAVQHLPQEVAMELGLLQQRLTALAEQERQLEAQRRVLRERQLALQLSREMEAQYERVRVRQQQQQEAKARQAEALLDRATQLASRGRFDEALELLAQAQALQPAQLNRIAALQEKIEGTREHAQRQAQAAQIGRLFTQAMEVFQQGRYEEAVPLFEQVIQQEASLGASTRSQE